MGHATTGVCAALAGLIRRESRQIARQLPVAAKGDVRAVHRARVASRRLRESVPVAGLVVPRSVRRLEERLRRLTRALGAVREIDVIRDLLVHEAARHGWAPATVARVDRVCRETRDRRRRAMLAALDRIDVPKMLRGLDRLADETETDGTPARAASVLAARLRRRAGKLTAALPGVSTLYAPVPLHAVRIASKKLRYTLELARAAASVPAAAPVRDLRAVQALLGGLHDRQSLQTWLQVLAAEAPGRPRLIHELDRWIVTIEIECRRGHARFVRRLPRLERLAAQSTHEWPLMLVVNRQRRMTTNAPGGGVAVRARGRA